MGKSSGGARTRRRVVIALAIASIAAVTLLSATADHFVAPKSPDPQRLTEATSRGGTLASSRGVDVPLALIDDYFEHGLEHAPPRDPGGVMQKREAYYAPPPDPISFLNELSIRGGSDSGLRRSLIGWYADWIRGQRASRERLTELEDSAASSTADPIALISIARALQFLDGDAPAAALIRTALAKADQQFSAARPGDPSALPLLRQLDQTKALWRLKDYVALEARFKLARRLYPPLSVESRRAGYLLADALFYQHRFKEAEATVLAVMDEHRRVGDLGMLDRGDIYEMNYQLGYLQYCAGDFAAAIGNLRLVRGGEHDQVAAEALFSALIQTGRLSEAAASRRELVGAFALSPVTLEALATEQEEATQKQEWQRETAERQAIRLGSSGGESTTGLQ